MKIVHVTDVYAPGIGGIERQVETLVRRQRAEGHDVTVVTATHRWFGGGHDLPFMHGYSRWATATRPSLPPGVVPDIVHGHLSVVSPLTMRATSAAARAGIPVVLTVHSLWPLESRPLRALLAALGGLPTPVVWSAVSRVAAQRVRAALPGRPIVRVVPNEVDTQWWRRDDRSALAGGIGYDGLQQDRPDDEVHAVLVNRLAGRKRVLPFVKLLGSGMPAGLRVTIVGDGPRRADIQTSLRRNDLGDRITLTGGLAAPAIRDLLHSADLFVAPARLESFGIAALEARAAGVPVLGFAGTGLADLIHDGADGLLVDSDAAMMAALAELTAHRASLRALQRHARTNRPRVDAEVAARALDALYAEATGAPAAAYTVGPIVLPSLADLPSLPVVASPPVAVAP